MEIYRIEKLHSIGYSLKDAKVTINQDIKFNVAGLKINGTQGEVLNLPQWIGKILSQMKFKRRVDFKNISHQGLILELLDILKRLIEL
ncbi:MAG: hypothetical protein HYZ55_05030 [Nitrosarchaeum sp.]|nr:hypothetical protein [Nitrosarchaeum sp.]